MIIPDGICRDQVENTKDDVCSQSLFFLDYKGDRVVAQALYLLTKKLLKFQLGTQQIMVAKDLSELNQAPLSLQLGEEGLKLDLTYDTDAEKFCLSIDGVELDLFPEKHIPKNIEPPAPESIERGTIFFNEIQIVPEQS